MKFSTYNMTEDQLVGEWNRVKDALFSRLESDGVIESAENLSLTYIVEGVSKGRFGRWWDKLWSVKEGYLQMHVLKIDHGENVDWHDNDDTEADTSTLADS